MENRVLADQFLCVRLAQVHAPLAGKLHRLAIRYDSQRLPWWNLQKSNLISSHVFHFQIIRAFVEALPDARGIQPDHLSRWTGSIEQVFGHEVCPVSDWIVMGRNLGRLHGASCHEEQHRELNKILFHFYLSKPILRREQTPFGGLIPIRILMTWSADASSACLGALEFARTSRPRSVHLACLCADR